MSDMLSIGASGVRAYQTALSTVSENIANAATPGYSRQVTTLREVSAPNGVTGSATGLGVAATGISRSGQDYISAGVRSAGTDLAKTETGITWLQRVEDALDGNQLGSRLTDFFNASRAVAADPSSSAPRAVMLESASTVAGAFAATGNALASAASDLDASAGAATSQLNGYATALAKVNAGLGRSAPGTSGTADLLDQRDQLLESMSTITNVDVAIDSAGRATVRAGNNGPLLVQGESAATVTYARNDEGAVSLAVNLGGQTSAMASTGGALAGLSEGAQRIAAAISQVDSLASNFVDGVNTVQAQGRDLSGNPGAAMFTAGNPPSEFTVALTDPAGIAAAAVGGGPRDNSNLASLGALRSSGGFETTLSDMSSANGAVLSSRQSVADAQTSIRDAAVAARDGASGVNIDEEAVDLLRFQQAYQASSRVIQTARDALQSILDIR